MTTMIETLILLLFWHALADYPLQGDFLAKAKNENTAIPGIPWWQAMTAHCVIHAGGVYVITGLWYLAAIEFVLHFLTDRAKCRGVIGFNADQFSHAAAKVAYAAWVGFLSVAG